MGPTCSTCTSSSPRPRGRTTRDGGLQAGKHVYIDDMRVAVMRVRVTRVLGIAVVQCVGVVTVGVRVEHD